MKSFQSYEASKIVNNCTVEMDFEVNNIVDSLLLLLQHVLSAKTAFLEGLSCPEPG